MIWVGFTLKSFDFKNFFNLKNYMNFSLKNFFTPRFFSILKNPKKFKGLKVLRKSFMTRKFQVTRIFRVRYFWGELISALLFLGQKFSDQDQEWLRAARREFSRLRAEPIFSTRSEDQALDLYTYTTQSFVYHLSDTKTKI